MWKGQDIFGSCEIKLADEANKASGAEVLRL